MEVPGLEALSYTLSSPSHCPPNSYWEPGLKLGGEVRLGRELATLFHYVIVEDGISPT